MFWSKDLPVFPKDAHVNFLIINTEGYGDTLVITSLLKKLRTAFKNCILTMVVSPKGREVLEHCSYINDVLVYDKSKNYWSLVRKIRSLSIDVCFDSLISIPDLKRLIFPVLIKSKYRTFFKRGGFEGLLPTVEIEYVPRHVIDNYDALAEPLIKKGVSGSLEFFPSEKDKEFANSMVKKYKTKERLVVLHACSENLNHLWPVEQWVRLAHVLLESNSVIFTVPKSGRDSVNAIIKKIPKTVGVVEPISFNQLAALIAASDLLITIDTCTVHIASATGTKSVIIYGPTIPTFWGPRNKNQIVLQKNSICNGVCQAYDMNTIFGNYEHCQEYPDKCINHITVDEVIESVKSLLKNESKE